MCLESALFDYAVWLVPSLLNIYKELADDIEGFKAPSHGCLVGWAKQGMWALIRKPHDGLIANHFPRKRSVWPFALFLNEGVIYVFKIIIAVKKKIWYCVLMLSN